jgi:hypothetical protein
LEVDGREGQTLGGPKQLSVQSFFWMASHAKNFILGGPQIFQTLALAGKKLSLVCGFGGVDDYARIFIAGLRSLRARTLFLSISLTLLDESFSSPKDK